MSPAAQALLALAETERELVADDPAAHAEALVELGERREEIVAMLPVVLGAEDHEALSRALEIQSESALRMQAARDQVAGELKRLDLGRRTARGYVPAGAPAEGTLSLRG